MIPYLIFSLGALLCVLNFYVSILRHPLLRCTGTRESDIRAVVALPLVGSLLVLIGWAKLGGSPLLNAASLVLIGLDTGGPHWLIARQVCASVRRGWNHEAI